MSVYHLQKKKTFNLQIMFSQQTYDVIISVIKSQWMMSFQDVYRTSGGLLSSAQVSVFSTKTD